MTGRPYQGSSMHDILPIDLCDREGRSEWSSSTREDNGTSRGFVGISGGPAAHIQGPVVSV